jgi:DNA-binding transcriptional LysR family regulator
MRQPNDIDARQPRRLSGQMDLNLLEVFDSVFRTRNLTASSVELALSQPAISRGLAKLRQLYDDALFVRLQRGVQPTPFAEQLAEPMAAALALVRGTIAKPDFVPAEARRAFRVSMSDIGERYFLPKLLTHLGRAAPGVTLETISAPRVELLAGLAAGHIDLAVGFLPGLGKQVREQRLFRERYVYVVRRGHPHIGEKLELAQLRHLPHVIANPPGTMHASAVETMLVGPRVRAPIVLRVRNFLCVGPVVADTELVAVVPSNLAAVVAGNVQLRLMEAPMRTPEFQISMVWHRRFDREPGLAWLRDVFAELFADGTGKGAAPRDTARGRRIPP